jgi:hypothetical protein
MQRRGPALSICFCRPQASNTILWATYTKAIVNTLLANLGLRQQASFKATPKGPASSDSMKRLAKELPTVEQDRQEWSLAASRATSRLPDVSEPAASAIPAAPDPGGGLALPAQPDLHPPQLAMLQPSTTSEQLAPSTCANVVHACKLNQPGHHRRCHCEASLAMSLQARTTTSPCCPCRP